MNILEKLAEHAAERVEAYRREIPLSEMKARALEAADKTGPAAFAFEKALQGEEIRFICECKKASPSRGLIAPDFPYRKIAQEYESAGAAAVSVLTEPKWFLGEDRYLQEIAETVGIPCLRKDFTVDEYMIWQAKVLGAGAVLLICSITAEEDLKRYLDICDRIGLSALTEAHDADEVKMAVSCGARVIGVNNRNLKDFTVDIHNSIRLREMAPEDVIFVAESGIRTPEDVEELRKNGVNAVLIGEQLMRAGDPAAELRRLRGGEQ
ncbi:MAG: indole-3-glycerol phosphate synthase TrpC [[Clostridium] aminophilum]|uniref:indole-3-glycerol phosphate synthase TrpC n=1 Tax=[Clostridium] aminophilum TaxID=1526 RepID=UPI0026EB3757|nr:indole-3-glycerol phosphate synthase TrpC [[Clostridium] aminophilum]MDD6196520.1 indole-3-glycerol phosphate synthase TrpC [[Clostridium] aminophilum]